MRFKLQIPTHKIVNVRHLIDRPHFARLNRKPLINHLHINPNPMSPSTKVCDDPSHPRCLSKQKQRVLSVILFPEKKANIYIFNDGLTLVGG